NPGTEQEIFSLDELINAFDLERVNKSGARFDPDKIKWFNHHYMQEQNNLDVAQTFKSHYNQLQDIDVNYIELVVGLVKERATFISDLWALSAYFFQAPKTYDEKAVQKAVNEGTKTLMLELVTIIQRVNDFTAGNIQTDIKAWITEKKIGFGKVMMPLRLALVGALQGPDVFEIMFMIGKKQTVNRIENLVKTL